VYPSFPPGFHPFADPLELFLLIGRKILSHFLDRLIEDCLRFAAVLPPKGMKILRGTAGDSLDFLPLFF
jgi:hypothetical protein